MDLHKDSLMCMFSKARYGIKTFEIIWNDYSGAHVHFHSFKVIVICLEQQVLRNALFERAFSLRLIKHHAGMMLRHVWNHTSGMCLKRNSTNATDGLMSVMLWTLN